MDDKQNVINTCSEYYLALKRKRILACATTWMTKGYYDK